MTSPAPLPPRFLVVLDVDATLIENEVIDLLAEAVGVGAEVAEITERAMQGELDFEQSLRARVQMLEGASETILDEVRQVIRPTAGAEELIAAVHQRRGIIGAVSGGFLQVLTPLAERLGLNHWEANTLEIVDGRLTGRLSGAIVDPGFKAATLQHWAQNADLPLRSTLAVGDGANDILMLRTAGLGVAFNAKQRARDAANLVVSVQNLAELIPLLPAALPAQ